MSQKTDSVLSQLILDLNSLARGLTEHASLMGATASEAAVVSALANELTQLNDEQEKLKADLERVTELLKAKKKEASDKRASLRLIIRGMLGKKSQLLEAFGMMVKS